MFKTCIFCNRNLGGNEVIENFPVGRRLAFDGERGRLWVICEHCRRWNLSPLEERWEAIEECERQYHDTPRSFSTDNIGLAQLGEGLHLVRIGEPKRREFAAWRYGRQFWRRRVKSTISTVAQAALAFGTTIAGANILPLLIAIRSRRVVARVRDESGARLYISGRNVRKVELIPGAGGEHWSLRVPYHPNERFFLFFSQARGHGGKRIISGESALRAAGRILPAVNAWGGSEEEVKNAVAIIEESRDAGRLFARAARRAARSGGLEVRGREGARLNRLDRRLRLALEMASHEDSERRALEGELADLEQAWRDAEEIAAIADRLLLPESVEDWIRRQKKKLSASFTSR
ncbi:MAG: hypothetical protein PVI01_01310 [Gemmatimonadales bacterium]